MIRRLVRSRPLQNLGRTVPSATRTYSIFSLTGPRKVPHIGPRPSFPGSNQFRNPINIGLRGLSTQEFHEAADETLEAILNSYEFLNEDVPDLDSDLSQGVLTVKVPKAGTYVINKQPPNQQIWLSSPISGPKRYDFVDGAWVYPRDQSKLGELLREETLQTLERPLELSIE